MRSSIIFISSLLALLALGSHTTPLPSEQLSVSCDSGPTLNPASSRQAPSTSTTPSNNATAKAGSSSSRNITATAEASTNSSIVLPDGRIAENALATDFNVLASVFKSAIVKGDGLVFSDIVAFPNTTQSLLGDAPSR